MVQIASGILGAAAATLAFGAVHLEVAAGNDLLGPHRLVAAQPSVAELTAASVNRADKGDRATLPAMKGNVTLSYRLHGEENTSVVMRIPVEGMAASAPAKPTQQAAKRVACEPAVSVLTPIAKQIEPGRCIT